MANFVYQPLQQPQHWIRVLTLERGNRDDPLRARISHEMLDEKPVFDAISYSWGHPSSSKQIMLRHEDEDFDSPLSITVNLDLALRRFRFASNERKLWNDAICINQPDKQEKKHQVRLMSRIYADARKVLIYLGEPDRRTTRDALNLIEKIHDAVDRSPADDTRPVKKWLHDNELPDVGKVWLWEPLKEFFRRPWFGRKWIIQEFILASQPIFHLGKWRRGWDYMAKVNHAIQKKGIGVADYTESDSLGQADQLQQGLVQFNNILCLREALFKGTKYKLMDLADSFQASRASDPRDHLFALLGIARDSDDPKLDPRYEERDSVLEICLDYANFFLQKQQNLEVLYRAGLQGQRFLAPSWVPDWYGGHEGAGFSCNNGIWDPLRHPAFYNVAHGTIPTFVYTGHKTIMGLRGIIIDVVDDLANIGLKSIRGSLDKDFILSQKRHHLEQSDRILSKLAEYPTEENLVDVYWRTLICNVTADLEIAPETLRPAYEAYRRSMLIHEDPCTREDMVTLQPFRKAFDVSNGDRVFGLTGAGYVGMFPQLAREGDVVAVLYGGEFPFVLRSSSTENDTDYELVGQCYIHGIMETGKLDLHSPGFVEQDFFLGRAFLQNVPYPEVYEQTVRAMQRRR